MQGNAPLFFLAICIMIVGATLAIINSSRPNGIAFNFGLIVMVNGCFMVIGLAVFAVLSAILSVGLR